jgi:hypothetical protein
MRVKRGSRNCDTEEDVDLVEREGSASLDSFVSEDDPSLGLFVAALLLLPLRSFETGSGGRAVVGGPMEGRGSVAVAVAMANVIGEGRIEKAQTVSRPNVIKARRSLLSLCLVLDIVNHATSC